MAQSQTCSIRRTKQKGFFVRQITVSRTFAAIPPIRTDFIKMPQSCRLRNTFVTLIPRLAKPDSPSAMWNVSLSLSSRTEVDSWSPLASDDDTAGDR